MKRCNRCKYEGEDWEFCGGCGNCGLCCLGDDFRDCEDEKVPTSNQAVGMVYIPRLSGSVADWVYIPIKNLEVKK